MKKLHVVILSAIAILWVVGALGTYLAVDYFLADRSGGLPAEEVPIGGPFNLVTTGGEQITHEDFRGKPFAVFFGFTHCPDVCPTTLYEMAGWIGALGGSADKMRFAFVSVDPERDTPEVMTEYVRSFSDRIIPLTGTPEEVDRIKQAYRVYARKVPLEDGGYTMDHSATVYLMDAEGGFADALSPQDDPDKAVRELRALLANGHDT